MGPWWFQCPARNRILGDLVFLSAIDGSFSNHQSTARNRSGAIKSKSALSRGRSTAQNGRGQPIVGFVGYGLSGHAKELQRYRPYPSVHQGDQS